MARPPARYAMGKLWPIVPARVAAHLQQQNGGSSPSYALSTFTTNDWDFTADNVDDATDTLTVYDTNGVLMVGATVVLTSEDTLVDAATCTLVTDDADIETTIGTANITAHVYNAAGVPLPGIPAASLSLASTGTGNTITAVDTVTDRNGRFRWTFVSTVAETKTLTLTAIGIVVTDTVAVTVGTPSAPAALWGADFSHGGTGTGTTAIGDDGRLDTFGGSGLEVIAATGLDFPATMSNVLRVTANATHSGFATARKTGMTVPAIGVTRYYRAYWRPVFPDGLQDNQVHPVQDGEAGSNINWEWSVYQTSHPRTGAAIAAGQYIHTFQLGGANDFFTQFQWIPTALAKGATYRFEWAVHRISSTEFNLHVRVYDSAGSLILSDADFFSQNSAIDLSDNPTLLFNNVNNLDGINIGLNGIGGASPPFPFVHSYQGGFITNDTDWCGPYVAGESD